MDRVLACFATTAEDVAAMVCGSFSSMVPQASERWQRPAVKALVRTIHQELCDTLKPHDTSTMTYIEMQVTESALQEYR